MKIYRDCDLVTGGILRGMIMNWLQKAGIKEMVSEGPPVGEWYAPEAVMYKDMDKEITDHMKEVIKGQMGGQR